MSRIFARLLTKAPQMLKLSPAVINNKPSLLRNISTGSALNVRVQEFAPDFRGTAVVSGNDFKDIQLCDFRGKYLVLVFYPLDFTFVCPTELIAFDERYEDFQKINTEVIGISVDSHYAHLAWMDTKRNQGGLGKLRFPLLSDITKTISRDYEVLLEKEGVALRGLFIIDPNGIVRQMSVNDLPIGRSVDETLRIIQALQFVEENGEVCPANWKKGEKTIKPDPKGSKEYFQEKNK